MVRPRDTRRADATVGAIAGLALAATVWTIASSPVPLGPRAGWLALGAAAACAGLRDFRAALRSTARLAAVAGALFSLGPGAAVATHLACSAAILATPSGPGRGGAAGGHKLWALFGPAAGAVTAALAAWTWVALDGPVVPGIHAVAAAAVAAVFALGTLAGAALARRSGIPSDDEPSRIAGAGLCATGVAAGLVLAAGLEADAWRPWWWLLPTALLANAAVRAIRSRRAETSLPPAGRSIARTIALGLAADADAVARLEHRQSVALDVGRRTGMSEARLAALEAAAWLFDLDRLDGPAGLAGGTAPPGARSGRCEGDVLRLLRVPDPVRRIVAHRYERWDGAGVPEALAGTRIPRGSRVLAVAAGYASLTTGSADRAPWPPRRALAELRSEAGRIYDPRVVDALAEHVRETEGGTTAVEDAAVAVSGGAEGVGWRAGPPLPAVQRELHALYEIGRAVGYRLDLDENLTLILEKLASHVPHACAVVWIAEPGRPRLTARFARGEGAAELGGESIHEPDGPSARAAAERRTTIGHAGPDAAGGDGGGWDLDRLEGPSVRTGLRSALAAPMVHAGVCLGTLTLYDRPGRRFGRAERRFVSAVAAHVARAVRSADPANPGYLESLTDPLTGLPNGRYLEIFSSDHLPTATGGGAGFGLLAFRIRDLDRLCQRDGIAAVEKVLGVVARRLAASCAETEVPVRYGHDLFVVLGTTTARGDLVRRWDRLLRATEGRPIDTGVRGQSYRPRLASAHATCPEDGHDLDGLLDVLGGRLGLAFERGHKVVPFRIVRSAS